jgi:hypothetical protein
LFAFDEYNSASDDAFDESLTQAEEDADTEDFDEGMGVHHQ